MTAGRRLRLTLALLAAVTVLLAIAYWRTPRIVALTPAPSSRDASTAAELRLRFSSPLRPPYPQLQLAPLVSGTQRFEDNTLVFSPAEPLAPATTYTVTLAGNAAGTAGPCLRCRLLRWSFQTASLAILYVAWDEDGNPQLWRTEDGSQAEMLTAAGDGIGDYAVSPHGDTIVYSARRAGGGADLWRTGRDGQGTRALLPCPDALCDGAVWDPGAQRLVYVRRPLTESGPGVPRLYWLDAVSGATEPVFANPEQAGWFPRFSPNGEWLAFVEPGAPPSVLAYPLDGGAPQLLPGETTAAVGWHPRENRFLSSVIVYEGERISTHLYTVGAETGSIQDISGDLSTDDSGAAWSPAGDWIAFARKVARAPVGKQIWLMRPDGSEAQPLTSDPDSNFSNLSWSPDGQYLLAQRFALEGSGVGPEVWLVEPATGDKTLIAAPAFLPAWLP
ncbi:MAG: Ig-like domain-containing protein [Anaerolineae bacterium]|nr:Ig-like domain-containing protein [Anaerolineae bacterium]